MQTPQQVKQKATVLGTILLLLSLAAAFLLYDNHKIKHSNLYAHHQINEINHKISNTTKKEIVLQNNLYLLTKVTVDNVYSDSSSSFSALDLSLDKVLYQRFQILNHRIVVSKFVANQPHDSENIKIIRRKVYVSFDTISDQNAFDFIQHIVHDITGFVMITSLKITKLREIDEEIIAQAKKGQFIPTVHVNMAFDLYNLLSQSSE